MRHELGLCFDGGPADGLGDLEDGLNPALKLDDAVRDGGVRAALGCELLVQKLGDDPTGP